MTNEHAAQTVEPESDPDAVATKAAVAADRKRRALDIAADTILGQRKSFADARRADPVLVVAAPDVPLGARLIMDRFGRVVLHSLAGALVIPMADDEFLSTFAGGDHDMRARLAASLARLNGGARVALVVNEGAIEVINVREHAAMSGSAS